MKLDVVRPAVAVLFLAGAEAALAQAPAACNGIVTGAARVSPATLTERERARAYTMNRWAEHKAVVDWKQRVAGNCPGYSTIWSKARVQLISCTGPVGDRACTARAAPRLPR